MKEGKGGRWERRKIREEGKETAIEEKKQRIAGCVGNRRRTALCSPLSPAFPFSIELQPL